MNPIVRNVLALITGFVIGSVVNMGLITLGGSIVLPPEGVDVTNMESLKANMHLFEPKHFLFPFLAHALGTLVGAFVAAKLAATHQMKFAWGVGIFFLIGGIANALMLPGAPTWFVALDWVAAYLPMGWLGGKLAGAK
ncbi:MAG: hypothetical protein AAGD05_16425 [Bacteroidota bacterium]